VEPAWTAIGENTLDIFGNSVASAGDVNGDGYADAIVGAFNYNNSRGRVYVFHGSASGLSESPVFSATGENLSDNFGYAVGSAGDVNGDGYSDVIVGAYGYGSIQGKVYVYHGSMSGLSASAAFTTTGENNGNYFGESVGTAGDVNGDGYADIIVGAYGCDDFRGRIYVYHGSSSGLSGSPAFTATGVNSWDRLGQSVASAGDVDGDGYADIIAGADGYNSGANQGQVYVYHGSAVGLDTTATFSATGENDTNEFGYAVGTAGDVNGDSYTDIIIGAYSYSNFRGKMYVYYGNDGGGRLVLARQQRGDGSGIPVPSGGMSHKKNSIQVSIQATNPQGRSQVKLEVQVCPTDKPFGDAACLSHTPTSWTDVTTITTGISLLETIAGLTEGTLYHWQARVLYAPLHVTETGITPPPNPAHGPWRQIPDTNIRVGMPPPDLELSKTATHTTVEDTTTITYTITIDNVGGENMTGIIVSDTLPVNVTFATSSTTHNYYDVSTGIWNVGSVTTNTNAVLTIVVTGNLNTDQTITNTAILSASTPADTNTGNDSDSVRVTISNEGVYLPIILKIS
jgi:uncharacterized repeat protein (TIGR01451 family)